MRRIMKEKRVHGLIVMRRCRYAHKEKAPESRSAFDVWSEEY